MTLRLRTPFFRMQAIVASIVSKTKKKTGGVFRPDLGEGLRYAQRGIRGPKTLSTGLSINSFILLNNEITSLRREKAVQLASRRNYLEK